ncbi:uncharacterized protein [Ptychodera flava]|uniref:uncharacterized protein n=1 Tax=Ptychodera flava TaxID=63121 RepID=UPI00396AAE3B
MWSSGGKDRQARVCSEHFRPDDFSNMLQYQCGFAHRLLLKDNAVPSLFGSPESEEPVSRECPTERDSRMAKRERKELLREILLPRDTNPQEQKENIEISTLPHDVTSHQCCHCSGTVVPSVSDATTQTDLDGIIVAVSKDHGYATNLPVTADRLRGNSSDGTTSQGTTTDSGGESQMDTEGDALDNHTCDTFDDSDSDASDEDMSEDPDFIPYTSSSETDSEYSDTEPDIIIDDPVSSDPAEQMKFLVFESSLIELFTKCQRKDCPAQVISMQKLLSGSRLIIKTTCSAGCHYSWSSQPT